jgi:hypothetical protein
MARYPAFLSLLEAVRDPTLDAQYRPLNKHSITILKVYTLPTLQTVRSPIADKAARRGSRCGPECAVPLLALPRPAA